MVAASLRAVLDAKKFDEGPDEAGLLAPKAWKLCDVAHALLEARM